MPTTHTNKRQFTGTVVSTGMKKTVVVSVDRVMAHPKYQKRYVVSKRYKAHDEKNACVQGDTVIIEECRPISKDKRWRVVKRESKEKISE